MKYNDLSKRVRDVIHHNKVIPKALNYTACSQKKSIFTHCMLYLAWTSKKVADENSGDGRIS